MFQSDDVKDLSLALSQAQAEMGVAGMTGHNPMFKSKFSTLADFIEATGPALAKHKLTRVLVHTETDESGRVFAVGVLRHGPSGQWISARLPLLFAKADMQGLKSALTYATRMLTQALTGCASAEAEDDGNVAAPRKAEPRSAVKAMEESARGLRKIREGTRAEAEAVMAWAEGAADDGRIRSSVLDTFRSAFSERFDKEVASV